MKYIKKQDTEVFEAIQVSRDNLMECYDFVAKRREQCAIKKGEKDFFLSWDIGEAYIDFWIVKSSHCAISVYSDDEFQESFKSAKGQELITKNWYIDGELITNSNKGLNVTVKITGDFVSDAEGREYCRQIVNKLNS